MYQEKLEFWPGLRNWKPDQEFIIFVLAEYIFDFQVSGKAKFLPNDVPNMIEVVGRIAPDMVWSYIAQMKKSGSKVSYRY